MLKIAANTRLAGQIMDGGATRMRLHRPPIEKPISWVDMTSSHWSGFDNKKPIRNMDRTGETKIMKLTGKGRTLIVENSLDGNDVGLNKIGARVSTRWDYTHGVC